MAGPIGMAVLAATRTLRCPHCGARQVRDRHASRVRCKKCMKVFAAKDAIAHTSKKR